MGLIYARGSRLWMRVKDEQGEWTSLPTPFAVGDERKARALVKRVEERRKRKEARLKAQQEGAAPEEPKEEKAEK